MIRYCPQCWTQNDYEATICARCGSSLDESDKDYAIRLIDSVEHPEPTSAAFAIEILGRYLGEPRAVDAIITRLERHPDSMDVTAAAAEALGYIGDPRAIPALSALLANAERPLPARVAAAEALARLDGDESRQALTSALDLPHLPRILHRLITNSLAQEN
jgi:HEAT repeat protein